MTNGDLQLDELLQAAHWPEMPAEATARLRATLENLPARRGWNWIPLAAAAGIAIVVGVAAIISLRSRPTPHPTNIVVAPVTASPAFPAPRPINNYERMILAAGDRRAVKRAPTSKPSAIARQPLTGDALRVELSRKILRRDAAIEESEVQRFTTSAEVADFPLLRRCLARADLSDAIYSALLARKDQASVDILLKLILDPTTRSSALAALRGAPQPPLDALIARLDSPLVDQRFAAAKALGSLCHGQTLDLLKRMVARDDHRREALAALISCSNPSANEFLSNLRRQPALRAQLIAVQDEMKSLF